MEHIWLKSYPAGVPADVDVDAFLSVVDLFERSCAEYANRPAYINMGATLSYAEVDRLPGAGLLSLAFLVFAGTWTKARGFLAR